MINNSKSSWQDLPLRIVSALVIIPIALFCIIYGQWFFIGLLCIISVAMTVEWANLFKKKLSNYRVAVFLIWPLIAYAAVIKGMWWPAILIVGWAPFIFGPQLWLGSVVIGGAGISLLWLRFMTASEMHPVIFIVIVVIVSDSFAYIAGKTFGGPKLIPSVSPGKTWSGAIGGLIGAGCVGSIIVGYLCGGLYTAYIGGAIFGMVTGIVAQIGDLLESKLKRELGVKDSGKIIPGHGGVLDRFDALLFVSIFVALISCVLPADKSLDKWGGSLLSTKTVGDQQPIFLPLTIIR
ncbi:CDP-diglyceride synthetase (CdsA) (PDB:4Q2E) [Commensalibacter communis]|uniref:phosphatidate cytidylyltransferase n=1 Tax=Commensalibacter communis TaxID=2972786 RepID=UPI0022FFB79A|nr:phosphatidate cytidylyltransferase [Commensalibacter communis]CAI3936284.1 CDP-diglyceride synthetase (CdsA) (PDB:4Q2E) [Commensalibacter communis]CAI3948333.1 CDP-diglyceride synthetase (CdsA) (PDB:4Q2E) [Commensalibacter communis]CAI3948573.1 CDP-diglyceride synthetase (CdsA) (PDB:4Q2E) [Commensalibacter communis]